MVSAFANAQSTRGVRANARSAIANGQSVCVHTNVRSAIQTANSNVGSENVAHTYNDVLYGFALWRLSSSSLRTLEVIFNNLLRRIWKLPLHCQITLASLD